MLSLESVDLTDVVDLLPMDAAVDLKPVMRVSTTVDAVLTEDLVLDEEALFLDSHWMMELSVSCRKLVARLTSQQGTKTVKISRIQIETAILFRENQKASGLELMEKILVCLRRTIVVAQSTRLQPPSQGRIEQSATWELRAS